MQKSIMFRALLLLAFAPGVAGSQTIYKCTLKGKPTSYQNEPCAANAKIAAIRDYQPESPLSLDQLERRRALEARGRQESAYLSRIAGTDRSPGGGLTRILLVGGSACENAKRDRDAWERQVGLSRNVDTLRQMNDMVHRACK